MLYALDDLTMAVNVSFEGVTDENGNFIGEIVPFMHDLFDIMKKHNIQAIKCSKCTKREK